MNSTSTKTTLSAYPSRLVTCALLLGTAVSSNAALQLTLGGGGGLNTTPLEVTLTDLTDGGSPADVTNPNPTTPRNWDNNGTAMLFSGFLQGFTPADSLTFAIQPYASSSLSGNTLTTNTQVDLGRNISTGWSVLGGDGGQRIGGTEALVLVFQDIPDGFGLRITEVSAGNIVGTPDVQVIVDGSSVTNLGGTSASGLSIDLLEGQRLAFRDATALGEFRVRTITLETFPLSPIPSLNLSVVSNGSDLDFTWDSQAGKVYDLLSTTDPEADGDPETWTVVTDQENIVADPPANTLTIARPADPKRFYVIREKNAPPPPPLFSDDFESDMGWQTGIGANHVGNAAWELGPPDINFVDGPDSGANGSANCYGTDLDNNYEAGTEIWLRSPPINLAGATSATLSFWHIFDVNGAGDETGVVRVLRSSDNSVLGEVETFNTFDLNLLDWFEFSEALPAAALGETILLEFLFTVAPGAAQLFPGWYIDDVMVEAE